MNWQERFDKIVHNEKIGSKHPVLHIRILFTSDNINPFAAVASLIDIGLSEAQAIERVNSWYNLLRRK